MDTSTYLIRLQHLKTSLPYLLRSQPVYKDIINTIDLAEFEAIIQKYSSSNLNSGEGEKFLNSSKYIRESVVRALMLDLNGSQKYKILDIGSGTGYFLFVCKYFGHEVQGLDLPDSPLFNDLIAFFQIPRVIFRVEAFKPLPSLLTSFHLITAWSICFDREWGIPEWEYFLKDVQTRLSPGGRVFLRLNISGISGIHNNPELKTLFCHFPGFRTKIIDRRNILFFHK